ncbi:MAG: hypothetical protein WKF58_08380 [Ilumatobacteraceae bacterium]
MQLFEIVFVPRFVKIWTSWPKARLERTFTSPPCFSWMLPPIRDGPAMTGK